MQISTPFLYRGLSSAPESLVAGRNNRMDLVLRKYLLHVALMGVLLAVGTTEGECGMLDMNKCEFGVAHLLWFFSP